MAAQLRSSDLAGGVAFVILICSVSVASAVLAAEDVVVIRDAAAAAAARGDAQGVARRASAWVDPDGSISRESIRGEEGAKGEKRNDLGGRQR